MTSLTSMAGPPRAPAGLVAVGAARVERLGEEARLWLLGDGLRELAEDLHVERHAVRLETLLQVAEDRLAIEGGAGVEDERQHDVAPPRRPGGRRHAVAARLAHARE